MVVASEGRPAGNGGSGLAIVKQAAVLIPKSAPGVWSMNTVYDLVKQGCWSEFNTASVDYLVVAGGGGGGGRYAGGAGAGGYRTSFPGGTKINLSGTTNITIGAGGAGGCGGAKGTSVRCCNNS